MRVTGWLRRNPLEAAWAVFAAANWVAMVAWPAWETIPFHFVWISLTFVYGVRVWSTRTMWGVLSVVIVATGVSISSDAYSGIQLWGELFEVPLMSAMFLAMVWHAQRRQVALAEVQGVAEMRASLLERQERFLHDASHELRTPVTIARGHLELLRREQPLPAHHLACAHEQMVEQPELAVREVGCTVPHARLTARDVEDDVPAAQDMLVAERGGAAEPDADPREQLIQRERLRDVVRRPQLEAAELRLHVASRGEDHHRQLRLLSLELAQDLQAVQPRQQQVEHDEVPARARCEVEPFPPVARRDHGVPLGLQPSGEEGLDSRLVLDDQDAHPPRGNLHRCPMTCR